MKNVASKKPDAPIKAEYGLDYAQSRPNRFAKKGAGTQSAVILAPDVARVFDSAAAVNKALRAFIRAMPAAAGQEPN